jgi:two-component system, OmpR family, response regulator
MVVPALTPYYSLLVSRQSKLREPITKLLHESGWHVRVAEDGPEIYRTLADSPIDIAILDMRGPTEIGLDWCRRVRSAGGFPIIMLVCYDDAVDGTRALELGADDFIRHPFCDREFRARLAALLRRCEYRSRSQGRLHRGGFEFAGWTLDEECRTLRSDEGRWIALTPKELALLVTFCEVPSRKFTREQLVKALQGECDYASTRNVDVYVHRLRHKLERDSRRPMLIRTIRPDGYVFTPKVTRI